MKARKRNSNDDWEEVEYVQLRDSYVITKADQMEFDVSHGKEQSEDEHWNDVRERASIAAMQGTITILSSSDSVPNKFPNETAEFAVACADALIEELKRIN